MDYEWLDSFISLDIGKSFVLIECTYHNSLKIMVVQNQPIHSELVLFFS